MKIKKIEVLYFIAIAIIIFNYFFNESQLFKLNESISNLMTFTAYILLVIKIIYKENVKKILIYGFVIFAAVLGYLNCGLTILITMILVVIGSKEINIRKIIKFVLWINIIILTVHIICYIFCIIFIPDAVEIIYRDDRPRYNFFLGHPNFFSAVLAWTTIMYLYLRYEKINALDYLISVMIAIFIYVVPNSRTSALLIFILLIMIPLYKKNIRIVINISRLAIPILFVIFFTLIITYNINPWATEIDRILSSRLRLGAAIYENYGIHWFGEFIPFGETVTNSYKYGLTALTTDSAYQTLVFCYGISNTLIFLITYIYLSLNKQTSSKNILFLVIWAIFAITETIALNPLIGFPLLFGSELLSKNTNKLSKKYNKVKGDEL